MKDQDAEEIIFEGLKVLGKLLEKPEPEPEPEQEESVMGGGGGEQPQMQAQELEHDHQSHPSLWHEHTQVMIASVAGTIGLVVAAYFGYKAAQKKKS